RTPWMTCIEFAPRANDRLFGRISPLKYTTLRMIVTEGTSWPRTAATGEKRKGYRRHDTHSGETRAGFVTSHHRGGAQMTVRFNADLVKIGSATVLVGILAVTANAAPAFAQAATPQTAQPANVEEIVVTGTRIIRNGYEAPTPVEVLSADDINAIAQPNIADAVNRLPALQGSLGPQNASTNVSS